jgi:hypothetical protein
MMKISRLTGEAAGEALFEDGVSVRKLSVKKENEKNAAYVYGKIMFDTAPLSSKDNVEYVDLRQLSDGITFIPFKMRDSKGDIAKEISFPVKRFKFPQDNVDLQAVPTDEFVDFSFQKETPSQVLARTASITSPHQDDSGAGQDDKRPGDGGDDVAWVQRTLNDLGHNCGPEDGIMGPNTRSCIRSFQEANGLELTGEVNEATYEKILEKR